MACPGLHKGMSGSSFGCPTARLEGDRLVAAYCDNASGKTTIKATWQFLPQEAKAVLLTKVQVNIAPNK